MQEIVSKNVWKSFGIITAVKGLSFEGEKGQTLVILGPSGAGKTTTLRLIAGLEELDQGEIYLGGKLANDLLPYQRNLAMTFESYALYPHMTVSENIAFPLKAPERKANYSNKEIKEKVREVAQLLGIDELLNRMPRELSGGQRQRVALGRTLIKEPRIFLFDEPIAHLDAKLRHRMRGEMKRLFKTLNSTVIYTTHDYIEASAIGDKVVVINKGELQQVGEPQEIYNHPINDFVFGLTCDPSANFFQCKLVKRNEGYYLENEDITLSLPKKLANKILLSNAEREIRLGIRPIDIVVSTIRSEKAPLPAEIYTFEPLGSKLIITIKFGQSLLKAKLGEMMKVDIDQKIWIGFSMARLYLFDLKTGINILKNGDKYGSISI